MFKKKAQPGPAKAGDGGVQSMLSFDAKYLGCHILPDGFPPGVESVQHVLPMIKKDADRIASKVSLTVSIYGIKAMRNQFAGMKQKEALEVSDGGVSFDFVCNESIYRVAFCADVGKEYCFITQNKTDLVYRCYAFTCKSKKVSQQIADATALACQRVFRTLALLRSRVKSLAEANAEVHLSRVAAVDPDLARTEELVELINFEGYADADEKFRTDMLEMAGAAGDDIPYQTPRVSGPDSPSKRTQLRASDPNEYERTRF
eukprot:m.232024 g.232024  ORF g.232024 m.232024 type:complete len:260 (-) comp26044_c0_seq1:2075-2854(-)